MLAPEDSLAASSSSSQQKAATGLVHGDGFTMGGVPDKDAANMPRYD